jgi:hypothetical protein
MKRSSWLLSSLFAAAFATNGVLAQTDSPSGPPPELFCVISAGTGGGGGITCQYKDRKDSSKPFSDEDILSFMSRAERGAYITVRSKRGFERTFEVDPTAPEFRRLAEARKNAVASEIARLKLDIFQSLESKAIQVSDGLDTIFIQSDLLKYDPAVATDKCKMEMKINNTQVAFEKNVETVRAENKALSVVLSSLIKAFRDPSSCLSGTSFAVGDDGSIDLGQLQGLAQSFRTKCKKK